MAESEDAGRDIVLNAAVELARAEGYVEQGFPSAAVLMAVVVDENGEDHIVGKWTGGWMTAIGLAAHAQRWLLSESDDEED